MKPEPTRDSTATVTVSATTTTTDASGWQTQLNQQLTAAAHVAIDEELDLNAFLRNAWVAYVEARPGMREHLEDVRIRAELEEMRGKGQIATA